MLCCFLKPLFFRGFFSNFTFMKKFGLLLIAAFTLNCSQHTVFKKRVKLPKKLKEVSGNVMIKGSDLIWMHNDGGNKSEIYGVNTQGKIERTVNIKAKNNDWEDISTDEQGNLYIADFGNNNSERKNLVILKIANNDILTNDKVAVEKIKFSYPEQHKFPPKKSERYFDAEALIYFNNYLYIFTKSRVKGDFGKTSLYKIPAKKGNHIATFISSFNNCNDLQCWITGATLSPNKNEVALLTHNSVLLFSNFKKDDFLNGTLKKIPLKHTSQKEGICFKDNQTLYITDEREHGSGGNLFEFIIK